MRNFTWIIGILALVITACEGDPGPPGPPGLDGLDGLDGVNILGQVIEIEGTFSADNDLTPDQCGERLYCDPLTGDLCNDDIKDLEEVFHF